MKRGPKPDPAKAERLSRMVAMHQQGMTLEKIGQQFGLTRARVGQLMKQAGQAGAGRKMRRALESAVEAQESAAREAKSLAKWGCDSKTRRKYWADGTLRAYVSHRNNAKNRGVPFELTFVQWLAIWDASGKFELRGRGAGKYCMSWIRDDGAYAVGNVHIQLFTDNSREAVDQWRGKPKKTNPGVFHLYPGLERGFLAKVGSKRIGLFATEDEAVKARINYVEESRRTQRVAALVWHEE